MGTRDGYMLSDMPQLWNLLCYEYNNNVPNYRVVEEKLDQVVLLKLEIRMILEDAGSQG